MSCMSRYNRELRNYITWYFVETYHIALYRVQGYKLRLIW